MAYSRSIAAFAALLLASCAVGPDYERPSAAVPAAFKEAEGWKIAEPADAVDRGAWWSVYRDPVLDELERQVEVSNQNLKAFEAAYRQAAALIDQARAGLFPTIGADASRVRSGAGENANSGSNSTALRRSGPTAQTQYNVAISATWEIDLWGRIRRTVESNEAQAQASAGDLASAKLSAQAALATNYFALRVNDELKRLLDETVDAFTRSLEITRNRYNVGTAARTDVAQAEAQLESTRAQAINVGAARAQLEHAIAVLIGKPPAEFAIAPAPLVVAVPNIPPGLPTTLLERRPDIAATERRVAAANAQIGVAEAAFYPNLTLDASYGLLGPQIGGLLAASHAVWSLGVSAAQTLIDFGARSATVRAAGAGYDQTVATYRQTVLTAFQQVEDQLAILRILAQQQAVQGAAVRASEEAERLTLNQYRAGTQDYTAVITTQTQALTSRQNALNLTQTRLAASVALIQALGGGWHTGDLPLADARPTTPVSAQAEAASD